MTHFALIGIGCLECDRPSVLYGVYHSREDGIDALLEIAARTANHRQIFAVEDIRKEREDDLEWAKREQPEEIEHWKQHVDDISPTFVAGQQGGDFCVQLHAIEEARHADDP